MAKPSVQKKNKRQAAYRKSAAAKGPHLTITLTCRNCGGLGPHFVPPSFGDAGFYICEVTNV